MHYVFMLALLLCGIARGQAFRITSATPNGDPADANGALYAQDSVTFTVTAVRENVTMPISAKLILREYNLTTGVLIRELMGANTGETAGAYRLQLGGYRVPAFTCFQSCKPGETLRSTEVKVRIELQASLDYNVQVSTRSERRTVLSGITRVPVQYPTISGLSVPSVPLHSYTKFIRLTAQGTKFRSALGVTVSIRKATDYTKLIYGYSPDNADPYEYWFLSPAAQQQQTASLRIISDDTVEFSLSTQVGVSAFSSELPTRDSIGAYDVVVNWQEAPGGLFKRIGHAYISNGFQITDSAKDDSTTITKLEVGIDRANPDPAKRGSAEWTPGGANTLDASPRVFLQVKLTGKYKLSRYQAGLLWLVMRDKATKQNLYMPWDFARNTAGKERDVVSQGDGRHVPIQFNYRLPATASDLEFFLVLTPQDQPTPTNYDTAPFIAFKETFAESAVVSVTWNSVDSVSGAGPPARIPLDTRFVTPTGPGIRTPCRTRSSGAIEIPIDITRVMGDEIDSDGRLLYVDQMAGRGVISRTAKIRISSFGRRLQGTGPRKDRVFLNDKELDPLTGPNEAWNGDYAADIDMGLLRFPARVSRSSPIPRTNKLRIEIDAADPAGPENWCMSVGWAEIAFNALAPVVFVHGNGQGDDGRGGDFWEGKVLNSRDEPRLPMKEGFLVPFKEDKITYYSDISMLTQSTQDHGALLGILIPSAAREWGAKHVHIVTHSKGALDSRDFMARFMPPNFGVYSIHTVSGPHQGSPGPDYQLDAVGASVSFSDDSVRTEVGALSAPNPGTQSLRVSEAAKFNLTNIPALPTDQTVDGVKHTVQYRALSGDMNLDNSTNFVTGNPTISINETEGLPGQGLKPDFVWSSALQTAYRIVGYVASTYTEDKVVTNPKTGQSVTYKVVREKLNSSFKENDICVTRDGAKVGPFQELYYGKANHSTVATPLFARKVIESIRLIQPVTDDIP